MAIPAGRSLGPSRSAGPDARWPTWDLERLGPSYAGQMTRTVTITDAKAHLLSLIDSVVDGDEILITRHGRTVARLVPAHGDACDARRAGGCRDRDRRRRGAVHDGSGVGPAVTTLLLDTHVIHWWASEPDE